MQIVCDVKYYFTAPGGVWNVGLQSFTEKCTVTSESIGQNHYCAAFSTEFSMHLSCL